MLLLRSNLGGGGRYWANLSSWSGGDWMFDGLEWWSQEALAGFRGKHWQVPRGKWLLSFHTSMGLIYRFQRTGMSRRSVLCPRYFSVHICVYILKIFTVWQSARWVEEALNCFIGMSRLSSWGICTAIFVCKESEYHIFVSGQDLPTLCVLGLTSPTTKRRFLQTLSRRLPLFEEKSFLEGCFWVRKWPVQGKGTGLLSIPPHTLGLWSGIGSLGPQRLGGRKRGYERKSGYIYIFGRGDLFWFWIWSGGGGTNKKQVSGLIRLREEKWRFTIVLKLFILERGPH